jgi:DNA-binding Xre family transcriptional regulator
MTTEDKLKEYILDRYSSLREFTLAVDMSYSTVASMLTRGIENSSLSIVIKICKVLGISVDELAEGRITPVYKHKTKSELTDISEILDDVKNHLEYTGGLTIDGKPAKRQSINSLVNAIEIGEQMAKNKN